MNFTQIIEDNWEGLTVFFDFPIEIRQIIYNTNLIKNKLSFRTDDAELKSVYLALSEVTMDNAKKKLGHCPGSVFNNF